jgi:glycerate kinase
MRVLVAFDKFKDALTAREACEVAARALRERHPDWQLELCPLSDGGDGFEAVLGEAVGGKHISLQVTGPRGGLGEAGFTLVTESQIPPAARASLTFFQRKTEGEPQLAIIEMAAASGLSLLTPSQRDPWQATSHGTGQLIRAAMEHGADAILLGVGGSATHDLGLGALSALGLEFHDTTGAKIRPPSPAHWEQITRIEGAVPATLPPIYIACDVSNPLLGPQGAATVFAPQKGLRAEELPALEEASERMAQMLCAQCHQPLTLPGTPGTGAAGGIAFGLICAARAQLLPGFALVSTWLGLEEKIQAADLVLTGEGRFDASSHGGKGPGSIAARAINAGKTVHVFAGQVATSVNPDKLTLHEITPTDVPLDSALHDAAVFLSKAIQRTL